MAELINRPDYLNQLIQTKMLTFVKIVTGIRRCGQIILFGFISQILLDKGIPASNIIHMNMESFTFSRINQLSCFFMIL